MENLSIPPNSTVRGAYLHVPFCFHKCHYCDFYSIVETRGRETAFVERLVAEVAAFARRENGPIETIFIGGGTPTLLPVELWERLLPAIAQYLPLAPGRLGDSPCASGEFTVEANPETVTDELADALAAGGVNRVSIGAQSFDSRHLATLERRHDPDNVARSIERFRSAGIDNINLDLICAIPGQTVEEWLTDLDRAISLRPAHLSCYTLIYEPNTPLALKLRAGTIQRVDEEIEAAMYEAAIDRLAAAGFRHYEISNWARPGVECRHNLLYWRNENWWPFGPSAAGHVNGLRWKNVPRLGDYLRADPWPPVVDVELLDSGQRIGEILMLRLRLIDGIPIPELDSLLGDDESDRRHVIDELIDEELLERTPMHLKLTRLGLLLADTVFSRLL